MRHYYEVMGPMYARRYDPAMAKRGRPRRSCAGGAQSGVRAGWVPAELRSAPGVGAITAPTLVLAGRHDWICPPEFSEEIDRLIPGSDLRMFEHSSHSIRGDEPEQLIEAIAGFVGVKSSAQGG